MPPGNPYTRKNTRGEGRGSGGKVDDFWGVPPVAYLCVWVYRASTVCGTAEYAVAIGQCSAEFLGEEVVDGQVIRGVLNVGDCAPFGAGTNVTVRSAMFCE